MQKINPVNLITTPAVYITTKIKKLSSLRIQDGFLAFKENPSDRYDQAESLTCSETEITITDTSRINAADLFSLFTANIIKEEVLFIR